LWGVEKKGGVAARPRTGKREKRRGIRWNESVELPLRKGCNVAAKKGKGTGGQGRYPASVAKRGNTAPKAFSGRRETAHRRGGRSQKNRLFDGRRNGYGLLLKGWDKKKQKPPKNSHAREKEKRKTHPINEQTKIPPKKQKKKPKKSPPLTIHSWAGHQASIRQGN